MSRVIFAIILVIVTLLVSVISFFIWLNKKSPNYVWKKLQSESSSSIIFQKNGERTVDIRSDQLMPLASTVKIMVAIEYAFQVEEGKINSEEYVNLNELEKYYLPKLDGGAHQAWIDYLDDNGLIQKNKVTLREVARGMIAFSSNANTEYLMRKLDINRIEKRMKEVGVKNHTALFYVSSALFIPYELKVRDYPNMTMKQAKEQVLEKMKKLTDEERIELSNIINEKLTFDDSYKEEARILEWWDMDYDLLFSQSFIKSTTVEYAQVMSKINNQQFPPSAQKEIEYILGMIMESKANQQWLERAGKKGGSTQYILTDALFAEDKKGNKYEVAIFFNELKWYEAIKLMNSLNEFELKLLSDETFQEKIINEHNK